MRLQQIISIIMFASLLSCSSFNSDLVATLNKIRQSTSTKIEPLPTLQEYTPVKYMGMMLNDPFDIMNMPDMMPAKNAMRSKNTLQRPDFERQREYLESFPLESFTMVGTLERKDDVWGLVIDSSGILHKVKQGNYMGHNSGKIIKITEDEMKLEELVIDDNDNWVKRQTIIQIKQ